jgi:hypothetical protein
MKNVNKEDKNWQLYQKLKIWRMMTSNQICSINDIAQLSTETNQCESTRIDEHSRSRRPRVVRELPDLSMNSIFVFKENPKLWFVSLTHDYDYESRFFQKNFRNFEFITSVHLRWNDVMIFNLKKHFAIFFIKRFQHIAKLKKQNRFFEFYSCILSKSF